MKCMHINNGRESSIVNLRFVLTIKQQYIDVWKILNRVIIWLCFWPNREAKQLAFFVVSCACSSAIGRSLHLWILRRADERVVQLDLNVVFDFRVLFFPFCMQSNQSVDLYMYDFTYCSAWVLTLNWNLCVLDCVSLILLQSFTRLVLVHSSKHCYFHSLRFNIMIAIRTVYRY